jgi:hypothetical protein
LAEIESGGAQVEGLAHGRMIDGVPSGHRVVDEPRGVQLELDLGRVRGPEGSDPDFR